MLKKIINTIINIRETLLQCYNIINLNKMPIVKKFYLLYKIFKKKKNFYKKIYY